MQSMVGMIVFSFLLLIYKILMSIWIYKDAKSRNDNAALWTLASLFISTSIVFLVYIFTARKDNNIACSNCRFIQSSNLRYCGNCGERIIEDPDIYDYEEDDNRIILKIGIIFLIIAIIVAIILFLNLSF